MNTAEQIAPACETRCAVARERASATPGQWFPCDYCGNYSKVDAPATMPDADDEPHERRRPPTPEEQFAIDERRALRDMAAAAGWFRKEAAPPTWGIAARIESTSLESDVVEKRMQTIATPRKEGVTADVDREDYAERGRFAAQQLRALEAREHEEYRAKLAEFDAANAERTAALRDLEAKRDALRTKYMAELLVADRECERVKDTLTNEREIFAGAFSARESTTLRIVSERLGSAVKRTASECVGEVASTPRQRAIWEAADGRKGGSTFWSGCAKLGRPLWVAAVKAWANR